MRLLLRESMVGEDSKRTLLMRVILSASVCLVYVGMREKRLFKFKKYLQISS